MKPILVTLLLSTPAYADGIGQPIMEATVAPILRPAQDNGGMFKPRPQSVPGTPVDNPQPPRRMTKQEAVKSWGVSRWKDAPNAAEFRDAYDAARKNGTLDQMDWSGLAKGGTKP